MSASRAIDMSHSETGPEESTPGGGEASDAAASTGSTRVVHDLNNVLGGLLGLVELLGRDRGLSSASRTRLADVRRATRRAVDLVAELNTKGPHRSESEPGAGTSFEILLQRANETTGPDSTPEPGAPNQGTVLLVEDDDVLRATYEELLTGQGMQVIAAADGFNALLQANTHHGRIDLLISDIILPSMSGIELWRKLSRFRPEAQVLFISGNLNQARVMIGPEGGGHHLLGKPFTATALLESVRALLASSPFVRPGGAATG